MNEEMNQYLGLFLDEASEQLESLERDILELEADPSAELLGRIFRAAHTLKGSSRAMGFLPMGELTHAMEDILDLLRQNALSVTSELVTVLFSALDSLKAMREEIAETGQTSARTEPLCVRLRALNRENKPNSFADSSLASGPLLGGGAASLPVLDAETEALLTEALGQEDSSAFWVELDFAPDCLMRSVRAMLAIHALNEIGQVLLTQPMGDTLETDEFETPLFLLVQIPAEAAGKEELGARIAQLSETRLIRVSEWNEKKKPETSEQQGQPSFSFSLSLSQEEAISEACSEGGRLIALRVRLEDDCVMKSIRAMMVLNALEAVGSVIALSPNEEALELEQFDQTFDVLLASESEDEAVRLTIEKVSEAHCAWLSPWQATETDFAEGEKATRRAFASGGSAVKTPFAEPTRREEKGQGGAAFPLEAPLHSSETKLTTQLSASRQAPAQAQTVRVDVSRLDKLLNLIGELVIDRTRIAQLGTSIERQFGSQELIEQLSETAAHIGRITDELQSEIMKARLLPIDTVFNRFPRMMRDLALKLEKEVDFVIEGRETELDRSVIEIIGDPLVHMLRNSLDHGIELPEHREEAGKARTGLIWLRARHQENHIIIEVEDDGKGMSAAALRASAVRKGLITQEAAFRLNDREALQIIFLPGFSTAAMVTDVSGRGVGMDIVKSNLERLGATIDISSEPGKGSRFTIKLPLTLAIIRGLLVRLEGSIFALPLMSVQETLRVPVHSLHRIHGREILMLRGKTLPVIRLEEVFSMKRALVSRTSDKEQGADVGAKPDAADPEAFEPASPRPKEMHLVVVGNGAAEVGLVVDSLIGEQEVVIKTLGKFIGQIPGISGATILGDGSVALIADIHGIVEIAAERAVHRDSCRTEGKSYAA